VRRLSAQASVPECLVLVRSPAPNAFAPGALDLLSDVGRVFVFPCPDDEPSRLLEAYLGSTVTLDVGVELGAPPLGICLGRDRMLGTAVPEAAVDEDRDPGTGEGNIRTSRKGPDVHLVAHSAAMQLPAKCAFWLGPGRTEVRHELADGRARRRGFFRNG
jgi:hypothetical protein